MKAHEVLEKAASHMKDREATYDAPGGERSIPKAVAMFKALTGHDLTNEQGWLFMCCLKLVRMQQGDFRADNYEDLAAYAGLACEQAASDRGGVNEKICQGFMRVGGEEPQTDLGVTITTSQVDPDIEEEVDKASDFPMNKQEVLKIMNVRGGCADHPYALGAFNYETGEFTCYSCSVIRTMKKEHEIEIKDLKKSFAQLFEKASQQEELLITGEYAKIMLRVIVKPYHLGSSFNQELSDLLSLTTEEFESISSKNEFLPKYLAIRVFKILNRWYNNGADNPLDVEDIKHIF